MSGSFLRSTMWAAILPVTILAVVCCEAVAEDRQANGWRVVKPRSIIIQAEYALPKAEGDQRDGRLTVVKAGGGIKANIQRWRLQFEELTEKPVEEIDVSGTKVTLVDFRGTYAEPGRVTGPAQKLPDYRMLGAIISKPDGLWFVKGYGPAKTMEQHSDAFRAWVEARAVLPRVVSEEDHPAAQVVQVEIRMLGGEAREPLAGLDVTVRAAGKEIHGTTEADGGVSFELAPGRHHVSFTSPRALPYLRFDRMDYEYRRSEWRPIRVSEEPKAQTIDLVLADPCELVFRAVDADTGKGIAGCGFAMENPAGEVWAEPILNDTIKPAGEGAEVDAKESSELTDKQGYFRRGRGPWHEKWTYFVNVSPKGYLSASPNQVKVETSLGKKRVEHTFLFRRKDGGGS